MNHLGTLVGAAVGLTLQNHSGVQCELAELADWQQVPNLVLGDSERATVHRRINTGDQNHLAVRQTENLDAVVIQIDIDPVGDVGVLALFGVVLVLSPGLVGFQRLLEAGEHFIGRLTLEAGECREELLELLD